MKGHKKYLYEKNIKVAKISQIEKHPIKILWNRFMNTLKIGSCLPTYDYNKYQRLGLKCVKLYCFDEFKKLINNA